MTREQNDALYGPCAREFGHGHNYRIGVTLKGGVDARTGMIVNITEIKNAVQELILDDMDHRHLNHDSRLMRGINPTAENLPSCAGTCSTSGSAPCCTKCRSKRRRTIW